MEKGVIDGRKRGEQVCARILDLTGYDYLDRSKFAKRDIYLEFGLKPRELLKEKLF